MGQPAPPSLGALFLARAAQSSDRTFLLHRVNGRWLEQSYRDVAERVRRVASALVHAGLKAGDRVGILSENRPEWFVVDLACQSIGVVDVPVYPTCPAPEVHHVLSDSGCRLVFVSSDEQAQKIDDILPTLPSLQHVVSFEPAAGATPLADFESNAPLLTDEAWVERAGSLGRDDLASILYTSGTTGDPKGVMLTHGNFLSNVEAVMAHISVTEDDRTLSFLPLSHCFERTAGHYTLLAAGGQIAYASHLDRVAVELKEVQPTLVLGVPRFFEKVRARVLGAIELSPFWRRRLFRLAMRVGEKAFRLEQEGTPLPSSLRVRRELADRLVFSRLRERIGGRVRLLVSGGAPLDVSVASFFLHAGLRLVEGYGLTETSPVVACNTPECIRPGTVGRVLPGVAVEVADDGELLVRGPNVMRGYFGDDEATREVLDPDGTLHTGDIGTLDDEGFLRITDRKKEILVSAGGKNVSPQRVEGLLKRDSAIADACLIGDRRPYLVALVVPDLNVLRRLTDEHHATWRGRETMLREDFIMERLRAAVDAVNCTLAPPERVRRFALLTEPFSQDNRQLTPTLKVRRKVIEEAYSETIEELYRDALRTPSSVPVLLSA